HLVVVHSQASFDSDQVWSEWLVFLNRKKPVIPVIIENVELPYNLESYQFVDFVTQNFECAFGSLLSALEGYPIPPDPDNNSELLPIRVQPLSTNNISQKSLSNDDTFSEHLH